MTEIIKLFPAWAGVIPEIDKNFHRMMTFPRMGGGDPAATLLFCQQPFFSPHGRG